MHRDTSSPYSVGYAGDRAAYVSAVDERIARFGFAALRRVFDPSDIARLRTVVAAFFDEAESRIASGDPRFPSAYLFNPGNMAAGMVALDDFGGGDHTLARIVADSPAALCLRHRIGNDVLCSLTHSRLRKSYPQGLPTAARLPSTVAWHSDASPDVGYYNAHILWVPFTPCNDDYPGLEFELARDRGGSEIASVSLEEGDALFFTSAVRHRTALRPRSTEVRYSCDVRFFAPADVPARVHEKVSQAPFLWLRAFATKPW